MASRYTAPKSHIAAWDVMELTQIDGRWMREALTAGIHQVVSRRDYINKINVFPVPDADTGTNLAYTLTSVLHGTMQESVDHIGEFLQNVADYALDGARGNSGAIFAQYLQGFSEAVGDVASLDTSGFARAATEAAKDAAGAIANPREGTMLSVVRDHAVALKSAAAGGAKNFTEFLSLGLEKAQESLANTPNQLEVLKQAGVVDAGAQGFVDLLVGMQTYATTGSLDAVVSDEFQQELADVASDLVDHRETTEHQFCTEFVVSGDNIDRNDLRDRLSELDISSLVIAGTKRKVRVHLHIDNPATAFLLGEEYGDVSSQKADDMHAQQRSAHGIKQGVAIVSDSGADVPDPELERLNISIVPLRLNFGDQHYLDKVSLTPEEFYQRLESADTMPQTSQPPPGDFRRQFDFLGSHSEDVICLTVSAGLSGTWQAAQSAASRSHSNNIHIVDTKNASAGQGLLTIFAAEAASHGWDCEKICRALEQQVEQVKTFAVIPNLEYGVRGGRMPKWAKRVADWFGVLPVIASKPDGKIKPVGALFSQTDIAARFAKWISRRIPHDQTYRLMICHCNARDKARELRDALVNSLPRVQNVYLADAGSALGVHAGPGALIVGVQPFSAPFASPAAAKDDGAASTDE